MTALIIVMVVLFISNVVLLLFVLNLSSRVKTGDYWRLDWEGLWKCSADVYRGGIWSELKMAFPWKKLFNKLG